MSANHSSRQIKAVVRREQATARSASEVSITILPANSWFLTRGGSMHETSYIYIYILWTIWVQGHCLGDFSGAGS